MKTFTKIEINIINDLSENVMTSQMEKNIPMSHSNGVKFHWNMILRIKRNMAKYLNVCLATVCTFIEKINLW